MGKEDRKARRAAEREADKAKKKGSLSGAMSSMSLIDKRRQRRKDKKAASVPTMTTKAVGEFRRGRKAARGVLKAGGTHAESLR